MPQSFLFVRSQDRYIGTSSSFKVTLPLTYKNISGIALVACELPYAMYNLDGGYLQGVTFIYSSTVFAAIVPAGYYQVTDLQAWLLGALQSAFPTAGVTAVTYSPTSGKLAINYTGTSQAFSVQGTATGYLGRILGCDPANTPTFGVAGVLTLPYIATLAPVSTLMMSIAEIPSQMASTNNMSAFARIQLSAAPGSIVMANAGGSVVNQYSYSPSISTLSSLTVNLYSSDGTPVNLHSCDWAFTLLIQSA